MQSDPNARVMIVWRRLSVFDCFVSSQPYNIESGLSNYFAALFAAKA